MSLEQKTKHWEAIAGLVYMPQVRLSRSKQKTRLVMYNIVLSKPGISKKEMLQEYKGSGESHQNFYPLLETMLRMGAIYQNNGLYYANPNVDFR